jgi:WD40 repeat protein
VNLHGPVRVPETVGTGKATARISFDAWKEGRVTPTTHQIEIAAARAGVKVEPLSARLKRRLIHPDRGRDAIGLRFSPDGRRLLAASFPGPAAIQVWETETGKQLTKIETGYDYRTFQADIPLSPDWKTIFTCREKRKITPIERDGKRLTRWEFDGEVKAWDVETGELRTRFRHSPPRLITGFMLSRDASTLLTNEQLAGEWEGLPKHSVSLWDVKSGQCRELYGGVHVAGILSPDSKTVAVRCSDDSSYLYTTCLRLFDAATAKERLIVPMTEKFAYANPLAFTPDGSVLVYTVRVSASRTDIRNFQTTLKFLDVASGRELGSFAGDKNINFGEPEFSSDGKLLAIVQSDGATPAKVHLFESASGRLIKTIDLGPKLVVGGCAFSPDGKWLAAPCLPLDRSPRAYMMDVIMGRSVDLPQQRIHLIEVARGKIRETLLGPQGAPNDACFSPDGTTLATTGRGEVLLWDGKILK